MSKILAAEAALSEATERQDTDADALFDAIARIDACADDILCVLQKIPNCTVSKRWIIGKLSGSEPKKRDVSIWFGADILPNSQSWGISLIWDSTAWKLVRKLEWFDRYAWESIIDFPDFEAQTIEELLHGLPPLLEEFIAKTEKYARD